MPPEALVAGLSGLYWPRRQWMECHSALKAHLVEFRHTPAALRSVLEWANVMRVTGDHDNDERERCGDERSINPRVSLHSS